MANGDVITAEQLREALSYDPVMGEFRWLWRYWINDCVNARFAGKVAGNISWTGYCRIRIDDREYLAHRLAWLYVTGKWPPNCIDHRNLDKADNRFSNLRLATYTQNAANTRLSVKNTSGFKGVYWHNPHGKWYAQIKIGGVRRHLGYFDTIEEAADAYECAAREHHGEFARAS